MIRGRAQTLSIEESQHRVEFIQFELWSSVGSDSCRTAETGDPVVDERTVDGIRGNVRDGDRFYPS